MKYRIKIVITAGLFINSEPAVEVVCDPPFEKWGDICYIRDSTQRTWANAELNCQTYGPTVHLAGMETPEVIHARVLLPLYNEI